MNSKRLVVNASPLIVLAKVNHVHLLNYLSDEFVVPSAVIDEINAGKKDDAAKTFLSQARITTVATPPITPELASWDLGAGETAVLAYALAYDGWTAVLDDRAARRSAQSMGVKVIGTLAIVLKAKQAGLIDSAGGLLQQIIAHGFRIDPRLLSSVLPRAVNETWPLAND